MEVQRKSDILVKLPIGIEIYLKGAWSQCAILPSNYGFMYLSKLSM